MNRARAIPILLVFLISQVACEDYNSTIWNPYNLTDCRGETAEAGPQIGTDGKLVIQSWHIHYTTNTTDQERFYYAFIDAFSKYFPPASAGNLCPFGPNFGRFSYEYVCSLENAMEEAWTGKLALDFEEAHGAAANPHFSPLRSSQALGQDVAGSSTTRTAGPDTSIVGDNPWGNLPQRAFFVPLSVIDEAWAWSRQPSNHGYVDLLLHPNTGCMHDDHSLRNTWDLAESDSDEPTIDTLAFPCNMPATGCNDNNFAGEPSCGCETDLESDAPEDSCENCATTYYPSW